MTSVQSFIARVLHFFGFDVPPAVSPVVIEQPLPPVVVPAPDPLPEVLKWDTRENIIHSIRLIADQEGLPLGHDVLINGMYYQLKDTLQATIEGESGFDLNAINRNYAFHLDGTKYVASTDYGLCQWNDYYHKNEITPDESLHDPEKACRLMARYWKIDEAHRRQWIAYKGGRYIKFLPV